MFANPLVSSTNNHVIESHEFLRVRLKRFTGRSDQKVVVLPVGTDESFNPVGLPKVGFRLRLGIGEIVDIQNGLETLTGRDILVGDAADMMTQEDPDGLVR